MKSATTLANLMLDGKWPFVYPPALSAEVRATLRGEWDYPLPAGSALPDDPRPRRLLDVGAGVGAFACWAFKRFKGEVFIDGYENDAELAELARVNAPPGAKIMTGPPVWSSLGTYDVIKISGALSDRTQQHTPEMNLVRLVNEASIVMFEWRAEFERLRLESIVCDETRRPPLRCFASYFDNVSHGRQVWVRSQAKWDAAMGRYVRG